MALTIVDCDQGSEGWFRARMGIPSASEFHTVMAVGPKGGKSVGRVAYLNKLAGELLTGEPAELGYCGPDMERGKVMEDEARDLYAFTFDADPQRVGFVRNGDKGASPDSLIDTDGGLEIKSAAPHVQIARLLKDELPSEHRAQVQGNLWVCERQYWDFISYCPKLPLFRVRVYRDETYIAKLAQEVDLFNIELRQTVEFIRKYGQKEAA
jgi:hypothetical protein